MKLIKKYEDYKYHAKFSAVAKCVLDESTGKLLAVASLDDLKAIIPSEALTEGFEDLLPIAANACVVNLGNKRGDMISTATALQIYKGFTNKFINIEHDRKIVVGHVANAGLSKFSSNYKVGVGSELLKEEAVASTTDPFNISLAGYIYAVAFPDVVQKILEANDPESDSYMQIGLSWELAFDSHKIAIGSRNLADCEIIDDPEEVEKYSKYLKANQGSGKLEDGREVYRLIEDGVIPLGVALTFAPAGQVTGIFTTVNMEASASEKADESAAETPKKTEEAKENKNTDENQEKVSQASSTDVTTNIQKAMKKTLKTFADLKGLNDENATEYSFANVGNLLEAEIEKVAKDYQKKLEAEATEKETLKTQATEALASVEALKKTVADLQQAQAKAEATQRFNDRMQSLDEEYELTDPQRKAIASQIRDLDDDAFTTWKTNVFEAFAAKKIINKPDEATKKPDLKVKMTEEAKNHKAREDKKKAKASDEDDGEGDGEGDEDTKKTAEAALKNATEKQAAIANTSDTDVSLKDKYKNAFSTGENGGLEIVTSFRR